MSEHFHYIEDIFDENWNPTLGDGIPVDARFPATDEKPREIEIGIVNRKPLYIVFRLDKLKLWGVDHE